MNLETFATGQEISRAPRLGEVDLSQKVKAPVYRKRLRQLQERLREIEIAYHVAGRRGIIVFEGWDTAGKGGTIRRMNAIFDPRAVKVWSIGAPRDDEQRRHYLYRFWTRLPEAGSLAIFDRSWYGRVLVERVEGFANEAQWQRAFGEINAFERTLTDDGVRLVKLFLHISPQEQRRRLLARLRDPTKRWKITAEDFRNRARWADYERAVEDMLARTSSSHAPWSIIPFEDKAFGRLAAIQRINAVLGQDIESGPPSIDPEVESLAKEALSAKRTGKRKAAGKQA